jgi:FtsH-binding integral membrane protein
VDWRVWFVQLSGWPVFLTVVLISMVGALLLSVLLPRIAHRSVIQNAVLVAVTLAAIAFGLLGLLAWLSRL